MEQVFLTVLIFSVAFAGLAIGVILTDKKELKGSCGGVNANPDCCMTCPEKDACDDADRVLEEMKAKDHPLLAQHPEAASPGSGSGEPVSVPR